MAQNKYASLESLQIFKENADKLYATQENVDEISNTLDEKANSNHVHNISDVTNLQFTIDEISDVISQKSQVQIITSDNSDSITESLSTLKIHKLTQEQYNAKLENGTLDDNALYLTPNEEIDLSPYAIKDEITSTYETKDDASNKLAEANQYTDSAVSTVKNDLLNGAGAAYDTLKELGDLINENVNAIEALEIVAANKADANHNHDSLYDIKGSSDIALSSAKTYTDNTVAQKSQVQIIIWEADD